MPTETGNDCNRAYGRAGCARADSRIDLLLAVRALGDAFGVDGRHVYLKLENLQMTGSFKERGALNKIAMLTPEQAERGVIAASAGNHAQGVAHHATTRGIRSLIVMPQQTPLVKVTATRNFGAEVVLHGANYRRGACGEARRICEGQRDDVYPSVRRPGGDGGTGNDRARAAGAGAEDGGGGGADRGRRADWRDCVRDKGDAAGGEGDWGADGAAAVDGRGAGAAVGR